MEYEIRFIDGILYEDQAWSYELFSHISSVLLLPQVTYVYENNPSSIVNTTFSLEKADKTIWSYTVSCNRMMDSPPLADRYSRNLTVDLRYTIFGRVETFHLLQMVFVLLSIEYLKSHYAMADC